MKRLLLSAACFNWSVALLFVVDIQWTFTLLGIKPVPSEPLFVELFATLVFCFGIGYFWASRDPRAGAPLIRLGAWSKLILVLVGGLEVVRGLVSWPLLLPLAVDLFYALVFFGLLQRLGADQRL
ncbi:hypothetical protein [Aestuariirhabdus litorea]|uniref:Uncharacterized protein n=1 Tax=Aestuariirhabdus litorea TaxID=2528527 RepID=A0A3P3VLL1_9GAMM|nr:hypothetical protein [Aestuariirhabdus litorea]RRJ83217.1 hypothetical protein D0544_15395 [Aestuariirhabdus litorea]RWW93374.1 hypothetical protein DZC74_15365 [Endozoicomonadaceae bacterium GTF-13]